MKICIVCSDGGHLTEMQQLMEAFECYNYFFVTYNSKITKDLGNAYLINYYGEKLVCLILSLVNITLKAICILIKERPKVIVSTGGEIAIPFCYIGKLLGAKIVYIESFTRVTIRSWSGKLVYPIADLFLVQWEQLLKKYGKKAIYRGKVI